jgi:ATP-dependent exoDNAse (exonuclease V) beta subunit
MKGTTDYLKFLNSHPRDERIHFDEGPHIYTIEGDPSPYTSVTTWNHSHFSHFDADAIIDKMMTGKNWTNPQYKYYGLTREQIKKLWDDKRDTASRAGTLMHQDIEMYYNGADVQNDSVEFGYFRKFLLDYPHLKPYRTEWNVFHEELKLSGSIDMVYENPDGTLQIYDWKRVEELKYEPEFGKYATTPCIRHMPDTNYWHYALQLNVYKMILETKYQKRITDMNLVCLHPENKYKSYQVVNVPVLEAEITDLAMYRYQQLENLQNDNHHNK